MEVIRSVVGTAVDLFTALMNSFTDLFLTTPEEATLKYLEEAELKTLGAEQMKSLRARALWEQSGAVIMAEAAELSSLLPRLEARGVPLYAVVKEDVRGELQGFRAYFEGQIFLDEERRFYGPRERRMGVLGFLRVGVWRSGLRAIGKGFMGNIIGEGFVLGGVFVIGPEQQGILLEHREKEFGDKVNIEDVMAAVRRIPQELQALDS